MPKQAPSRSVLERLQAAQGGAAAVEDPEEPQEGGSVLERLQAVQTAKPLEIAQQVSSKLARGTLETGLGVVESAGIATKLLGAEDVGQQALDFAATVRDVAHQAMPEVERLRDSFLLSTGPEALGSAMGFALPGAWLKAAGVPTALSTMSLGAAVQSAAQYEDARLSGASESDQWKAYLLGGAVGLSEAIPLSRILDRADKASGGGLKEALIHALVEGGEEFLQESGSTMASNIIASHILKYDEDRELLEGVIENGTGGLFAGVILSALATASAHSLTTKKGKAGTLAEGEEESDLPEVQPGAEGAAGALLPELPAGVPEGAPAEAEAGTPGAPEGAPAPSVEVAPVGADLGPVPGVQGSEGVGVSPEGGGAGAAPRSGEGARAPVPAQGAAEGGAPAVPEAPPGEATPPPVAGAQRRARLSDSVEALRKVVGEIRRSEQGGEDDVLGALEEAKAVLRQRKEAGQQTDIDAALEELVQAEERGAEMRLTEEGRIPVEPSEREQAGMALTAATIKHAETLLQAFDSAKGRAAFEGAERRGAQEAPNAKEEEKPLVYEHTEDVEPEAHALIPPGSELGPVEPVPIASVVRKQAERFRSGIDEERVEKLMAAMTDGTSKLPPVTLFEDKDGKLHVIQGHHRIAAAEKLGFEDVPARVVKSKAKAETKPAKAAAKPKGATARDAIRKAETGKPFKATLMRGQGRETSPYSEFVPQEAILGPGRYTTPDLEHAKHFGPNVTEHEAALGNPLVIDDDAQWRALTKAAGWPFPNPFGGDVAKVSAEIKDLRRLLESRGYDGVIVRLAEDDSTKTMRDVFGEDQVLEFEAKAPATEAAPKKGTAAERARAMVAEFQVLTPEVEKPAGTEADEQRLKAIEHNIELLKKKKRRQRSASSVGETQNAIRSLEKDAADARRAIEQGRRARERYYASVNERTFAKQLKHTPAMGMHPPSLPQALVRMVDFSAEAAPEAQARASAAMDSFRELVEEAVGKRELPKEGIGSLDWLVGEAFRFYRGGGLGQDMVNEAAARGSIQSAVDQILGYGVKQAEARSVNAELEAAKKAREEASKGSPLTYGMDGAPGHVPSNATLDERRRYAAQYRAAAEKHKTAKLEKEKADAFAPIERLEKRIPWAHWRADQKNPVKISVWEGDKAARDSGYYTNGRVLIRSAAVDANKTEKAVLARRSEAFQGIGEGVSVAGMDQVWKAGLEGATELGTFGDMLPAREGTEDTPFVVVYPTPIDIAPGASLGKRTAPPVFLNADYVALVLKATKADSVWLPDGGNRPAVFKKGKEAVALVMPISLSDNPIAPFLGTSPLEVGRLIAERKKELETRYPTPAEDAGIVQEDPDIEDEPTDGSVSLDPGELPTQMQAGYPADPILGGGANLGTPIGGRLYGALQPPPKPGKLVSQPDIIEALSKVVEATGGKTPIRWGRLGMRGARGVFKVGPEVIRVRTANNVATATHEVGHAIEKHILGFKKGGNWKKPLVSPEIQKELVALGKALYGPTKPAGGYKTEGFAEFIRLYTTEPASALARAPKLHAWFEAEFIGPRPEVKAAIERVRELTTRWRAQGSVARATASMVEPTSLKEKAKKLRAKVTMDTAIELFVEAGRPLNELAREAEKRLGRLLDPKEDPFFLFQALRSTHSARVKQMVESGMVNLAGEKVGPPLADIRPLVGGRYREFVQYLWAKRGLALLNDPRGAREPGLSRQDAEELVKTYDSPAFQRAAQMVYDFSDGVLNYAAQASPEFADIVEKIRDVDPGSYIPLQREFDVLDSLWGEAKKSRGMGGAGSVAKKLKGSGRRIKNPFPALLANAERTVLAAHRRMVFDAVFKLSQVEGLGHLIEEVPVDQVPVASATIEQLLERFRQKAGIPKTEGGVELKGAGLHEDTDLSDLLGETLTFFAPAQFPKGQDPVIPRWRDGQVRWYRVHHKLASMLAGMDVYRLPKVADLVLGVPARMFRLGTTGLRASFGLITNPMRDFQVLWQNTRSSAWAPRLFFEWVKQTALAGLHHATGGVVSGPYLQAFLDLGTEMAQPMGQDMDYTARTARRLFQNRAVRIVDPRNLLDFVRNILQFPETGARVTELKLLAREIGWTPGQPMTIDQSLQLLLASKQSTVDFTAAGTFSRVMNQMVPFHNAPIQGMRASVRAARKRPGRWLFRGLQMTAATLALWWWNKDKEWYRELSARARALYWAFPFTWNGREELALIPRAQEGPQLFGSLPEALADSWYRQDPKTATEFFGSLFETLTPNMWPVIPEEIYEQARNRDRFWDMPIVPTGELRRPPEEQAGEYTSEVAKFLGELFKVSPRRIDHAIRGAFGGVATDVIDEVGLGGTAPKASGEVSDTLVLGRLFQRGGPLGVRPRSVDVLYDEIEKADQVAGSVRRKEEPQERARRLMLEDAGQAVSSLSYVRSQTTDIDQRRELTRKMVEVSRRAVQDAAREHVVRGPMQQERKRAERAEKELKR